MQAAMVSLKMCHDPVAGSQRWQWWIYLIWALLLLTYQDLVLSLDTLEFTQRIYNATIPENSVGKTYVIPSEKMGIFVSDPSLVVRYKIVSGDLRRLFKAEVRQVGDFCFLLIRTRTEEQAVLNREYQDLYSLDVRAFVTSLHRRSVKMKAETTVDVHILDTNDLNPLFYPTEYDVTIPEDTPLHRSILQVTASDPDIGVNGEIYFSLREATLQFAVHPTRGTLTLTRPLDFQEQASHLLTIVAQDRGPKFRAGDIRVSTATVRIQVTPVNLHSPEISVKNFPSILENSDPEVYAIVKVTDKDLGTHGEIGSLEIVDGNPDGHFRVSVGRKVGEFNLELERRLDQELAPGTYSLTLKATDRGQPPRSTTQMVEVKVHDNRGHPPVFNQSDYEVEVEEVAPIHTPLVRVMATSQNYHAEISYNIESGNDMSTFAVNPNTGLIEVVRGLDRETKPYYSLTVSATDRRMRGQRRKGTAIVNIRVLDNNDNDPIFNGTTVTVFFDENKPLGSLVYSVHAYDQDEGDNGYVTYSLANLTPIPFVVDHFTGDIKTKDIVDYETMRRDYLLKVRASDWGSPYRRQAEMSVRVIIRDVNDHRPLFERVDCVGYVSNVAPLDTKIMTLSAIDFDAGGDVSYRMVPSNDDPCFRLETDSGVVKLTCDLAEKKLKEVVLNVSATDGQHFADVMTVHLKIVGRGGGKRLTDRVAVVECRDVGVTDRLKEQIRLGKENNRAGDITEPTPVRYGDNRHSPEFPLSLPSEVTVNESIPVGSEIVTLRARDRDHGYSGRLVYVISGGDEDSCFQMEMYTGRLLVASPLDREKTPRYVLNITAFDLGRPQKSISRSLVVNVEDVNDNAPTFEKSSYFFTVPENAKKDTSLVRFLASDSDTGKNSQLTFALETDKEDFHVDPLSGLLTVRGQLDRERVDSYNMRVRVADASPDRPLSSTAVVNIQVLDINDNPPRFGLDQYWVKVREDLPVGTVVMVMSARDPDLDLGGVIHYTLVSTDNNATFQVDPEMGVVRLSRPLDFKQKQLYNVTVEARDRGEPSLASTASLLVEVEDVNDNFHPPKFPDLVATGAIRENQPEGTFVTRVEARDMDESGLDSTVTYSIRDGDGLGIFSIDDQGNIRTRALLDRETSTRYWLTVYAQDRGAVSLSARVDVYIEVLDENDNVPLTLEPAYYPSVLEHCPPATSVVKLDAFDLDANPNQRLQYRITAGDPQGFFSIDSSTGLITTTNHSLDREIKAEHVLEVTITDDGNPPLSSTTRVVVTIVDINDHEPTFLLQIHRCSIPELEKQGPTMCQLIAADEDAGPNGDITYSIDEGLYSEKFRIHPKTGAIYTQGPLSAGQQIELIIKATDAGQPPLFDSTLAILEVLPRSKASGRPPVIRDMDSHVVVTESDKVGELVALVNAEDPDGDQLWYTITGGNIGDVFMIRSDRNRGAVLLARPLDRDPQDHYNLTISITDGVYNVFTILHVKAHSMNKFQPEFSEMTYTVDVTESIPVGTEILKLEARDRDQDTRLLFTIHSSASPHSMQKFHLDSIRGVLSVVQPLDHETIQRHILTVMVKDSGTLSKKSFARIEVKVQDHNDHAPEFLTAMFEGQVYETATVGTSVVQVLAIDRDRGRNAQIAFSIFSGNVGGAFTIDPTLGLIKVAKELDRRTMAEYFLIVRATDYGQPTLNSSVTVHILVTVADNAPPKFSKQEYSMELYENDQEGVFVAAVSAISRLSVYYDIVSGNLRDSFVINPTSGVIHTSKSLDYEDIKFYNLTVQATNMVGTIATATVLVNVLDRNDNAPTFFQQEVFGTVSEIAEIGSIVFDNSSHPLVVAASDKDSGFNALLSYEILDKVASIFFRIDSSTGAISTAHLLDHEHLSDFTFAVQVTDAGKPQLSAEVPAVVHVQVTDANDCPPQFESPLFSATVLLPTYKGVKVTTVKASDPDIVATTSLKYNIVSGNYGDKFVIDEDLGIIFIRNPEDLREEYQLVISVSDGEFETSTKVTVRVKEPPVTGLKFSEEKYEANILENSAEVHTVAVIIVVGAGLNEHLVFSILNPSDMFEIGETSGIVRTTGQPFDRELQNLYTLVVEVRSDLSPVPQVAHVLVEVSILDVNDNAPIFVNLPYYSVVPVEAQQGYVVRKVHAVDLDLGINGYVHYELVEGDNNTFRVDRLTGEITLLQPVGMHSLEYQLTIAAIDGGDMPLQSTVAVPIRLINRDMPVFPKQFYNVSVPESLSAHSPVLTVLADSPGGRQLIYSIVGGNSQEDFGVDFNTDPAHSNGPCVLFVVEELDYEATQQYQLTLRATDSVSGAFANVLVTINIEDINDNPPLFDQSSYNATVSEAAPFGTSILQVHATDKDSGYNNRIQYFILGNASSFFHVEPSEGIVFIKQSLNHELLDVHQFVIMATDGGSPALSSTTVVWVKVLDINDNPPRFGHPTYSCVISEHALRGQFVTMVIATDPDITDQPKLVYSIVGGNELQAFSIDSRTGILSLSSVHQFTNQSIYSLNISVTDGVYSSYTRVRVDVLGANQHSPIFTRTVYEVAIQENVLPGGVIVIVKATDEDKGDYGKVSYSIQSNEYEKIFQVDIDTGAFKSLTSLDREKRQLYEVPVVARDGGGRLGYASVRVTVTDANDNAPQFSVAEYRANVQENTTVGTTILQVHATDYDEGSAASLEYSIYASNTSTIVEMFGISQDLGEIYLKKSAHKLANQAYQFFVQVRDRGIPRLESEVPINIVIVGSSDVIPRFEQYNYEVFLSEKSSVGTVVSTLNVSSIEPITYSFVSPPEDSDEELYLSMFSINRKGKIVLNSALDRETTAIYHLMVRAETSFSPPLLAFADIIINIMDENDNIPLFESGPYIATVAENIEKGSTILKIAASDADVGQNADVSYSFGPDVGDVANVFQLDSQTGWLTTMADLDREVVASYNFTVIAQDKGKPTLSSSTWVYISIQDYNDNPPLFLRNHYDTAINEDALPGTVIVTLEISDADLMLTPVEFYITGGNSQDQFQVRQTGEIYVNEPLDREDTASYLLDITATDGTFVSWTQVAIDVLDANDNPPWCLKSHYKESLSENTPPQTYILTVEATDADDRRNSQLRYYLTGQGVEDLFIDSTSGIIKTVKSLDREHQSRYLLTAHVQDRGQPDWKCTSTVEVVLTDFNDNAPEFTHNIYSVIVPEDTDVGILIAKVHATDRDLGSNRRISYSFIDSASGRFTIDEKTGIIRLNRALDREEESAYNLTIRASDHGIPQLSSIAVLMVTVQDINDNPPEFSNKFYHAIISEDSPIGKEVVRILATSRDIGVNAEITYSIISGNEHGAFSINSKTGLITASRSLDFEVIRDYFLTIQAVDGGTPSLSSQVIVNISLTDANDNSPVFSQPSYRAFIKESAHVGERVIQVLASDADSFLNSQLTFTIISGDPHGHFKIDRDNGHISVAAPLDREMISLYVLEVHCQDSGFPPLAATAIVNIDISDVNDNVPVFSQSNYTAIVQEGKPLGFTVLKFSVTDADAPPNTSPFTFSFLSGNEDNNFRLVQQDATLRTATKFDHKQRSEYILQVQVTDSGLPSLSSETWITVLIIEESRYPPVVSPLDVTVNSYLDDFPGGVMGRIHATDNDPYDKLVYDLVTYKELFTIDREDGTLVALPGLDVGTYNVNVSVTDGKFTTFSSLSVEVTMVTEDALKNSISIRLDDVTPEDFLLTYRKGFLRGIRNVMNVRTKDIDILSFQPAGVDSIREKRNIQDLDVLFAVHKGLHVYYPSKVVHAKLKERLSLLESSVGLKVVKILKERCTSDRCVHGECLDRIVLDETYVVSITTETFSYVAPHHSWKLECLCEHGYGGPRCDVIINECARKPCPAHQVCKPDSSPLGYNCRCPPGKVGPLCDKEKAKICHENVCYEEKNPISYSGRSYSRYTLNSPTDRHLSVSLNLRTFQATGNLMYASGTRDYSILEMVNGLIQYRFDCGSGEGLVRVERRHISDGVWHEVKVERRGNTADVVVDKQYRASGSAPGVHDILNLDGNDVYFGAEVHPHPATVGYDDVRMGFVGCLDDIRIDGVSLPLHVSGSSSLVTLRRFTNIEFQCGALYNPGICGSQPCANGGSCQVVESSFTCHCLPRFLGQLCEMDTNPCASSPCLNGGTCYNLSNDYRCDCAQGLSGKRCDYGRYCNPNPCRNGGTCEEGSLGPVCKCLGFYGDLCQYDVNECQGTPCANGATCFNVHGSFHCQCPPNVTGPLCTETVITNSITSTTWNTTTEEIIGIIVVIFFILLLSAALVGWWHFRHKRRRQRHPRLQIGDDTTAMEFMLKNPIIEKENVKRLSKISNLEASFTTPPLPPRPASYTPSTQESLNTFNKFDTVRSYGSAADDLETVPRYNTEFLQNLNKAPPVSIRPTLTPPPPSNSDSDSLLKAGWESDSKEKIYEEKIQNDVSSTKPSPSLNSIVGVPPPPNFATGAVTTPNCLNSFEDLSAADEDQVVAENKGYHWDNSGLGPAAKSFSNMTEVSQNEVHDSSSGHSTDSNSFVSQIELLPGQLLSVPSCKNPQKNGEMDLLKSNFSGASDQNNLEDSSEQLPPNFDQVLEYADDSLPSSPTLKYHFHSSEYSPPPPCLASDGHSWTNYGRNIGDFQDDDDVKIYGFPSQGGRGFQVPLESSNSGDVNRNSVLDSLSVSAGGYPSSSDISANVCELEDSEANFSDLDVKSQGPGADSAPTFV